MSVFSSDRLFLAYNSYNMTPSACLVNKTEKLPDMILIKKSLYKNPQAN